MVRAERSLQYSQGPPCQWQGLARFSRGRQGGGKIQQPGRAAGMLGPQGSLCDGQRAVSQRERFGGPARVLDQLGEVANLDRDDRVALHAAA